MSTTFRDILDYAEEQGQLLRINDEVDPERDIARHIFQHDGKPILFTTLPNYPGWRVASGIASSRDYFAHSIGVAVADLLPTLAAALENPVAPSIVQGADALCQEITLPEVNLWQVPILRHFAADGGRYITAGIVILDDPDEGPNVCFHRLMQLDERRFSVRIVEKRGTDTAFRKTEHDIPVAICVGNAIPALLAGSMSPPPDVDELEVANALAPTPVVRCKTNELYVPAHCELVLEGRLTHTHTTEGPFVDLTETRDFVRQQPIIEIDCITHRRHPIYQALLPGKIEHKLLMGMPKEPTIFAEVNRVCCCTNVIITPGGTSWLHAIVQIDKRHADDAHKAIAAAFRGHGSLKHVIIVDTDINPYDSNDVEWAIATRFQADRDLVLLCDQPGSSLDPSAIHVPGKKATTAKMGIDATIPWGDNHDRTTFEKVSYE